MKTLQSGIICLLLSILYTNATGQIPQSSKFDYEKRELFSDLPSKIDLNISALETLFDLPSGHSITMPIDRSLKLQGVIISKSDASDPNIKSVIIRSTNRKGATFTFTRIRKNNGSFSYLGRMFSYNHSDAFEIAFVNDRYVLTKKKSTDIINE